MGLKVHNTYNNIEGNKSYVLDQIGLYPRNEEGEWRFSIHHHEPIMAGRTDAKFERLINDNSDGEDERHDILY